MQLELLVDVVGGHRVHGGERAGTACCMASHAPAQRWSTGVGPVPGGGLAGSGTGS